MGEAPASNREERRENRIDGGLTVSFWLVFDINRDPRIA